tara:strand:- start:1640 stop:1858 length:219 start_codon:yes stop_codon:yes gene_type:complete
MESLKSMNNYIPDLFRVAFWVGTSSASSVLLLGTATHIPNNITDWRDIAVWGTIGVILGAHYGTTQRPWFRW